MIPILNSCRVRVFVQVIQAGMFNQNSTSGERRAFLEALLENDKDDEEVSATYTVVQKFQRAIYIYWIVMLKLTAFINSTGRK